MKNIILFVLLLFTNFVIFSQNLDDILSDFSNSNNSSNGNLNNSKNSNFDFTLSLDGNHKFDFKIPVDPDNFNFDGYAKRPIFNNEMGIKLNYKDIKVVSNWQLDLIMNNEGNIEKIIEAKPLENAIYWSPKFLKIGAGFQYYSWGVADKLNPTDNINPKDFRKGFDSDKLSVFSLSLNIYPVNWFSFESVFVPFEQSDLFPKDFKSELEKNDFFVRKNPKTGLSGTEITTLLTQAGGGDLQAKTILMAYLNNLNGDQNKVVKYNNDDFDIKKAVGGFKTNFRTRYVDFSFSYLFDIDRYWTPVISVEKQDLSQLLFAQSYLMGTPNPMLLSSPYYVVGIKEIQLEKRRIHRFGADVKINLDKVALWLEACYNLTDDYANDNYKIRNDYLDWTFGFDFNYGPQSKFYLNFQYGGNWNINFDDKFYKDYKNGKPDNTKYGDISYMEEFYYRAIVNSIGGVYNGLNQLFVLNMKFPFFDDKFTINFTGGYLLPLIYDYDYETKYGSFFVKPEFDIMPVDSLHILFGANLSYAFKKINGEDVKLDRETDKLGIFTQDNNVYFAISYKWGFEFKK